ncbi:class I SAM-dependent methyltransferase [Patescibacteria group bacterium]|nr:class I SAM-dependent methyltransferase [Patescibacteria group bacterium]
MNCPICKNINTQFIYKFVDGPTMQNKLHLNFKSALKEKLAVVNLCGCNKCGFVFNTAFNKKNTEYSSIYDNTQDNSKYFQSYLIKLAKRLNKKYQLSNKKVVEVGCGKGHFIKILYNLGVKKIKGYDPSYLNYDQFIDKLVTKEFFNEKNINKKADFIICRHVLEHIQKPSQFITSIEKCLANNGVIYFEFPDLEWIIKNEAFFDFFYEHCNYFSKKSLLYLFSRLGLKNIVFSYGLNGQYFQVEISRNTSNNIKKIDPVNFDNISRFINKKIKYYKKITTEIKNFIIWGGGGKGGNIS